MNAEKVWWLQLFTFKWDGTTETLVPYYFDGWVENEVGICIGWGIDWGGYNVVGKSIEVLAWSPSWDCLGDGSCFMPDENGNANVVIYID